MFGRILKTKKPAARSIDDQTRDFVLAGVDALRQDRDRWIATAAEQAEKVLVANVEIARLQAVLETARATIDRLNASLDEAVARHGEAVAEASRLMAERDAAREEAAYHFRASLHDHIMLSHASGPGVAVRLRPASPVESWADLT